MNKTNTSQVSSSRSSEEVDCLGFCSVPSNELPTQAELLREVRKPKQEGVSGKPALDNAVEGSETRRAQSTSSFQSIS